MDSVQVTGANVIAGNGLVAMRNFGKGEIILRENPLVICNTLKGSTQWAQQTNQFFASERTGAANATRLQRAVEALNHEDRLAYDRLYTPHNQTGEAEQIVDRFAYNSFEFSVRKVTTIHLVVYRVISSANHPCVPNATLHIDENQGATKGEARLVATSTISAGTEILVNYISIQWLDAAVVRRVMLQRNWGFDCACAGCAPPDQASIDEEERATAKTYSENFKAMTNAVPEASVPRSINRLRTYIDILGSLGIYDDKLSQLCLGLAELHFQQGDYERAMLAAQGGLQVEQHFYVPKYRNELNEIVASAV